MKALFILAILSVFALTQCYIDDTAPVFDDEMINEINSKNAGWVAGRNERFEGLTWGDARQLLGTIPIPAPSYKADTIENVVLPTSFDSRSTWPNCIHAIRNQGSCGSCWAFGAAESLEDRLCIASNGQINVVLSTQQIVSCDKSNMGCNGGYLLNVWKFLESTGTVTEACQKYASGSGSSPACKTTCDSTSTAAKYYKANSGSSKSVNGEENTGSAIQASGPIEGSFTVYQDFMSYKSGVYKHVSGSASGGHAIKMVGFGTDSSAGKYWICANSWGTSWGMNGYFYIARGGNECGIESGATYGTAKTT